MVYDDQDKSIDDFGILTGVLMILLFIKYGLCLRDKERLVLRRGTFKSQNALFMLFNLEIFHWSFA
jgi:hypothetical protein